MATPSQLSLDYKPNGYSMNTNQNPFAEQADKAQKLQEFLARLEEERLKIEAFKRELPLCMQLLNNAMEAYRRQLETYQGSQVARPVLEEFIPLKNTSVEEDSEKTNWMVSAQLWSSPAATVAADAEKQEAVINTVKGSEKHSLMSLSSKLVLDVKPRSVGAFHPFSKDKRKDLPELALASMEKEMGEESCSRSNGSDEQQVKGGGSCSVSDNGAVTATHRKARRCWSPDLHRRFVNALHRLGGSQAATPKQIRELMKVDGLTNDEVKSHLQKYRLHTRRPMQPPVAAPPAPPHLVVFGGIWVPPDYATSAAMAAAGPALYGAHPSPAHYCPTPQPPLSTAATQLHYHLPTRLHSGGGTSAMSACKGFRGSPESEFRSSGERSESIEEEEEVMIEMVDGDKAEDGR